MNLGRGDTNIQSTTPTQLKINILRAIKRFRKLEVQIYLSELLDAGLAELSGLCSRFLSINFLSQADSLPEVMR